MRRRWQLCSLLLLLLLPLLLSGCSPERPEAGDPARAASEAVAPREAHEASPAQQPPKPGSGAKAVASAPPRIVLLISIDTLRADHMSLYGYERNTTPFLELLASDGVVFDDASAAAPWTLPSHASMLTGLYPQRHGVTTFNNYLPGEVPTLADYLKPLGYRTGAIVSTAWLDRERYKVTRGFDRYLITESPPDRRSPDRWASDQALDWIRGAGGDRIFVFLHYFDVHLDYASEPAYEKLFVQPYDGPADGTAWQVLRANLPDAYVAMCTENYDPVKCEFAGAGSRHVIDGKLERVEFDAADIRHLEDLYDAGVRQVDTELGRFVTALRSEGLLDETLMIITSDHGEEFMDHGRLDHLIAMYQESLRVPLIVLGPGIPAGRRVAAPVSLVDLVPTILAQVGRPESVDSEGLDLARLWDDSEANASKAFEERFLYGEASGGVTLSGIVGEGFFPVYRSVRRGRYKLITNSLSDQPELYDLASDPGERENLAGSRSEALEVLSAELDRRVRLGEDDGDSENRFEIDEEAAKRLRDLGYLIQ